MKPFSELTPRQKFYRKNIPRLIIYGSFALVLAWSMYQMVKKQEQANASLKNVEDTMMNFYLETREQTDTVGMAAYMEQHLSPAEYQLWLQMGE
ncbi:hypothetical protein DXT99_20020 [Pontibacter diazotrophicus]|uniref:Uncharacterized protein n=1 Tax=Pontibacter diazotrophicus TaxID=1400979 RepID=A0A3D8L7C3_9BACT|nr:hypothetical protein [Pontibacter diazotrophicus]RDV13309.1 hypothetical protein DXT99_20020 [Pontibacter diazotrophicus]